MKTAREIVALLRLHRPGGRQSVTLFGIAPLALALAFVWPFGGGGRKIQLMAGSVTPAAHGTVTVKIGQNGNTDLDIKAGSLAPPSSLTPAENVYVVWIESPGHDPQNCGQLQPGQKENAELHTETAYKSFKLFITAQQNAQAQEPSGPQILSADTPRA